MNQTKKNIINANISLFNTYGVSHVSQHRVAEFLNISPGNVTYHFKKKTDAVEYLYLEYLKTIENIFGSFIEGDRTLERLDLLLTNWFKANYDHRFLFSELEHISQMSHGLLKSYESLVDQREALYEEIFNLLIHSKYVRHKDFQDSVASIVPILNLICDFNFIRLNTQKEKPKNPLQKTKILFLKVFEPFLTATGKIEFEKYI